MTVRSSRSLVVTGRPSNSPASFGGQCTDQSIVADRWLKCLAPLRDSRFLAGVDLLALADEPDEDGPLVHPFTDTDQQLGFGTLNALLRVHVAGVPRPLCFVEHDDVFIGLLHTLIEGICLDVGVEVPHKDPGLQRILQDLDERTVAREERCRSNFR